MLDTKRLALKMTLKVGDHYISAESEMSADQKPKETSTKLALRIRTEVLKDLETGINKLVDSLHKKL